MTQRDEIFISLDVETDGPCPGLNSMLALGAAAFHSDGTELGTWYSTLHVLPDAYSNQATDDWWRTQPVALAEVLRNRCLASECIPQFATWLDGMSAVGRLTAVAWPAAFDFSYVSYYLWRFAQRNPLGFSCLDTRSYMNGLANYPSYQGLPIKDGQKLSGKISKAGLRSHVAVDDAIEQGRVFMGLRAEALRRVTCGA
jgi:hypothetical protein